MTDCCGHPTARHRVDLIPGQTVCTDCAGDFSIHALIGGTMKTMVVRVEVPEGVAAEDVTRALKEVGATEVKFYPELVRSST